MRKVKLIYPNLNSKLVGQKLAIRDELQLSHLRVIRATIDNYQYEIGDGKGRIAEGELLKLTKKGALFLVKSIESRSSSNNYNINLILPLVRQARLEEAILGVVQLDLFQSITLYFSDYTRYTDKILSDNKLARFNKIITAGYSQSGSIIKPLLLKSDSLAEAIADKDLLVVPSTKASYFSLKDLTSILEKDDIKNISLVIGPEGGFSPQEEKIISKFNYSYSFKYRDSILTTETAAISFSAILTLALG